MLPFYFFNLFKDILNILIDSLAKLELALSNKQFKRLNNDYFMLKKFYEHLSRYILISRTLNLYNSAQKR